MKKLLVVALSLLILTFLVGGLNVPEIFASSAPKCQDNKPSDTPRIRKIYAKPDHVILYHTSVAENNSYYYVAFGFSEGDERFGGQFNYTANQGHWTSYSIDHLSAGTTYYFKVRGGNGCKPGNWSTWVKVTTPQSGSKIFNY